MSFTPEQFIFIALWLHFWGMVDDGYSGRGRKADWFWAHVIESLRREVLFIGGYAVLIDIHGVPDPLIAFLVVGLHSVAWIIGERFGLFLRGIIKPDEKPMKLEVNILKFMLGMIVYIIYKFA